MYFWGPFSPSGKKLVFSPFFSLPFLSSKTIRFCISCPLPPNKYFIRLPYPPSLYMLPSLPKREAFLYFSLLFGVPTTSQTFCPISPFTFTFFLRKMTPFLFPFSPPFPTPQIRWQYYSPPPPYFFFWQIAFPPHRFT